MAGPEFAPRAWLRAAAMLMASICLASAAVAQERPIVIGTGPVAGTYFPAGGAICSVFNRAQNGHGPRCLVETSTGSRDNLDRLLDGEVEFALVQSDWQYLALRGGYRSDGEKVPDLRAVFSLQAQVITVVVHPESDIAALDDLKGRRVNLGPQGSAMRAATETLLSALEWSRDDLGEIAEFGIAEMGAALCAREIDAFVLPVSHPDATVAGAVAACGAHLLSLPDELVARLSANWPFFAPAKIPAGLYTGQTEAVKSYGVRATLVTLAGVSEQRVFALTEAVFSDLPAFTRQLPVLNGLTRAEMMHAGIVAEIHRGALRVFQSTAKE